jgi:hypothetical protein
VDRGETAGHLNPPAPAGLHALFGVGVVGAGLGTAGSLGSLSVPASWAMPAPQIEPIPESSSATGLNAAAEVSVGRPPGRAFPEALMATMTGRRAITPATDRNKGHKDHKHHDEKPTQGN